jgi:hypothetical protein
MIEHRECSRVNSITKKNPIRRPSLKLIQFPFLKNEILTTKDSKMAHFWNLPTDEFIGSLLLESMKENAI